MEAFTLAPHAPRGSSPVVSIISTTEGVGENGRWCSTGPMTRTKAPPTWPSSRTMGAKNSACTIRTARRSGSGSYGDYKGQRIAGCTMKNPLAPWAICSTSSSSSPSAPP